MKKRKIKRETSSQNCNGLQWTAIENERKREFVARLEGTGRDCNTLRDSEQTAKTAEACSNLRLTAIDCNRMQQIVTDCKRLQQTAIDCNTLYQTAADCNRLQQSATDCNRLQHTLSPSTTEWPRHKGCLISQISSKSALQCVALCCNLLHCVAICCKIYVSHRSLPKVDRKKPSPPGGVFYLLCSLIPSHLVVKSLTHGS